MRTNCPNCGAPLDEDGKCTHCETVIRKKLQSRMSMTATEISFVCEEVDDDDSKKE